MAHASRLTRDALGYGREFEAFHFARRYRRVLKGFSLAVSSPLYFISPAARQPRRSRDFSFAGTRSVSLTRLVMGHRHSLQVPQKEAV